MGRGLLETLGVSCPVSIASSSGLRDVNEEVEGGAVLTVPSSLRSATSSYKASQAWQRSPITPGNGPGFFVQPPKFFAPVPGFPP